MPKSLIKRYLIVGGTAYLIEMASLFIFRHVIGFGPLKSVAISFWIGFIVAFVLQKLVTFQSYGKKIKVLAPQLIVYSILVAFNYALTLLAVKLFSRNFSVFIIRTVVIILITTINFTVYKVIFRTPAAEE